MGWEGWESFASGTNREARAHRQIRDDTDWRGLYDEGMRIELGGELAEGTVLVAPFTRDRELLVIMLPVPQALVGTLRETLEMVGRLIRGAGGLVQLLARRRLGL